MKPIKVPKMLEELHGKKTSVLSLTVTYGTAILAVVVLLYLLFVNQLDLPVWKLILFSVLIFDIAGGVISNVSSSTRLLYLVC